MIVQVHADKLRLIAQHEHGLVTGAMARHWIGASGDRPLSFELILACTLHDLAWESADAEPCHDLKTGLPHDFTNHPYDQRVIFYAEGIDLLEKISPFVALLTSMHYVGLVGSGAPESFGRAEAVRQARLRLARVRDWSDEALAGALRWLRFFDTFSLFACMTPPGVDEGTIPTWMDPARFAITPDGERLELGWVGDGRLELRPWPFNVPELRFEVPCVDLPRTHYRSAEGLAADWRLAAEQRWALTLAPRA